MQKQTGALLAPAGSVWERCRSMFPGMNLYDPDGRHANALGAYLSACTFFHLIYGRSPEGLAEFVFSRERCASFGGKERLAVLERIVREVVDRTMEPASSSRVSRDSCNIGRDVPMQANLSDLLSTIQDREGDMGESLTIPFLNATNRIQGGFS